MKIDIAFDNIYIVFLDIEMPGVDGIETEREIQKRNPDCRIIMATGIVDRFKEAFQIRAVRFVTKPFVKEEVDEEKYNAGGSGKAVGRQDIRQGRPTIYCEFGLCGQL